MPLDPLHIVPRRVERIWGRRDLGRWGAAEDDSDQPAIGEAWLTDPGCLLETAGASGSTAGPTLGATPGATLGSALAQAGPAGLGAQAGERPILVKLLFTAAPLSVQVHPTDAAARHQRTLPAGSGKGGPLLSGKNEAWHILEAAPDAVVWLGFRASVTQPALRTAALAGEVLGLLNRLVVHPGETLFVPAGTVHAVGPGLVLLEVQDPIDVTYRLYDYGRDRPLQIEAALAVADLGRFVPAEPPVSGLGEGRHVLAMAPRFVAETCRIGAGFVLRPDGERYHILVALAEGASLDGRAWPRGAALLVPAAGRAVTLGGAAGTAIAVIQPGPGVSHCIVQN